LLVMMEMLLLLLLQTEAYISCTAKAGRNTSTHKGRYGGLCFDAMEMSTGLACGRIDIA